MFRSRFTKTAVAVLAATLCSALLVVGCSDDCDCDDNGSNDNLRNSLANATGEAWITTPDSPVQRDMRLHGNGVFEGLNRLRNDEGTVTAWYVAVTGTWTTNGNRLTISYDNITANVTYSMPDNNTLHLTDTGGSQSGTYIRTSNVTIVENPYNY